MKDFNSLVGIWNEQKTSPVIDYKEVIYHYKKSRNKFSLKIWVEVSAMLAVLIFINYIWFTQPYELLTTHLALLIFNICCIYFVFIQFKNIRTIGSSNTLFDKPKDHINFIKEFRKQRHLQHTRNYKFYTIFMSVAFILLFVEFFQKINLTVMIALVAFTIAWFAVCYWYLMKVYIKKEEQNFNEMLKDMERLNDQFSN